MVFLGKKVKRGGKKVKNKMKCIVICYQSKVVM